MYVISSTYISSEKPDEVKKQGTHYNDTGHRTQCIHVSFYCELSQAVDTMQLIVTMLKGRYIVVVNFEVNIYGTYHNSSAKHLLLACE